MTVYKNKVFTLFCYSKMIDLSKYDQTMSVSCIHWYWNVKIEVEIIGDS